MTDEHQIDGTTVEEKLGNGNIAGYFDVLEVTTNPTESNDVANKSYIDTVIKGLDWQESVIDQQNDPPASPSTGDRYLVDTSPTGDWSGQANNIAEWDGSSWDFTVPDEGSALWPEDVDEILVFDGTNWTGIGGVVDHGNLEGLSDDDHTQYLLVDGTRAMSGSLDMGSNAISNASNITASGTTESADYTVDGSTLAQSVVVSGQTTLSSGSAVVDTGLSATDATFQLALGIDDPNADCKVAGNLFWDDSAGTYKIEINEDSSTSVDNPTVNYDVVRVR